MWKEFKLFAMKGNVIDLAVGVIIGLIFGKIDFTNLFITLGSGNFKTIDDAKKAAVPTLNYGIFINNAIQFFIIAFSIFIVIKQLNRFSRKKKEVEPEVTTKKCMYCFTEISIDATRCPNCTSILDEKI